MADNDFNSDGFPKDFSPRDFSETPRHRAEDAAKSAEGAGASEVNETKEFGSTDAKETKSFGHTEKPGKSGKSSDLSSPQPSAQDSSSDFWVSSKSSTPSEGAASRAHNPFTDSSSDAAANGDQFGSAQSTNDQPVFGGYTQQQGTSPGFGQFPQAGDVPSDSGQTLGDKKSQMSDALKGLGKKDGLLGGLFEFEFKHFLTLTLSLIHISEPTRLRQLSRMPSSA